MVRKINGKVRWVNLGRFPETTVHQARRECENQSSKLLEGKLGKKAKPLSFGDLFSKYMQSYAKKYKRTWKEDQRMHDKYFSHWDGLSTQDITRNEVIELHSKITKNHGPYSANRMLELLRKIFNYAIDNLELDLNNPAARIKKNREESRERFLNKEELRSFFKALESKETSEQWRDFFLLALWTGARRANIQAMRWEHLDLENGLWQIPGEEFKNGQPFSAVLNKQAREILKRRKETAEEESAYVFPSRSKSGHVMEPKKAWNGVLQRAGLRNVRIHDLRRTLGSWQAATGASLQVIGKTLGHRNQVTTAIYSRLDLEPVRNSIDVATAAMLEAVNENNKNEGNEEKEEEEENVKRGR